MLDHQHIWVHNHINKIFIVIKAIFGVYADLINRPRDGTTRVLNGQTDTPKSGIYNEVHKDININKKLGYYYGIREKENELFYGQKMNENALNLLVENKRKTITKNQIYKNLKNPFNKLKIEKKIMIKENDPLIYLKEKSVMSLLNNIYNNKMVVGSVISDTEKMVDMRDKQLRAYFDMTDLALKVNKIRKNQILYK